jgi:2-polyprenyl-3-methyl-5-hydroxy-6-metoxy-1,4-benzoquinol methylase
MFWRSLRQRDRRPEVMDDPNLPAGEHNAALAGLARINRWSGSARILWPPLSRLARNLGGCVRVLDVATGAGDVPIRLVRQAGRHGLKVQFTGCDISPTALAYAQVAAAQAGVKIDFRQVDLLKDGLPGEFDVVVCSLFLHHLDHAFAVQVMRKMGQAARHLLLINDLARGRMGYLLAAAGARALTRSRVVHVDGPLSVRAAFTPAEALDLAKQAGLAGATVARRWPCRFLLSWRRP